MKIAKPKKVVFFKEGDRVKNENPKFPTYVLEVVVTGTYQDDRQLVTTDGGREWALFDKYLSIIK